MWKQIITKLLRKSSSSSTNHSSSKTVERQSERVEEESESLDPCEVFLIWQIYYSESG